MFSRPMLLIAAGCFALFTSVASGAELKVLSANVFTSVLDEYFHAFEAAFGHKVTFEYATAGKVRDRINSGERADIVIATRPVIDQLEAKGKIAVGTKLDLAHSAVALVVQKSGARTPDISSVEAFKEVLQAAASVTYPDPARGGATGVLVVRDLDQLGIAGEIKTKAIHPKPGHFAVELVASGEAEIAFAQPMEAVQQPGVKIVGLLPPELQNPVEFTFTAAELAAARDHSAAQDLLGYLTGPQVQAGLTSKGMEGVR
jgi:molybdate transport system substrate-binding protein